MVTCALPGVIPEQDPGVKPEHSQFALNGKTKKYMKYGNGT